MYFRNVSLEEGKTQRCEYIFQEPWPSRCLQLDSTKYIYMHVFMYIYDSLILKFDTMQTLTKNEIDCCISNICRSYVMDRRLIFNVDLSKHRFWFFLLSLLNREFSPFQLKALLYSFSGISELLFCSVKPIYDWG